tara:strand:+ start:7981 stop:8406 length:426 start_codon:yes stop_codon:yes gene_type:complete
MAYKDLSTTSATLTITSNDLSSSPINIYCNSALYKRGSRSTGLDVSSGVQRFSPGQTGATKIIEADNVTADKNGFIYIKNLSTTAGEECIVLYGSTSIGNIPPGSFAFIPYDGNSDVNITCASAGATQEIEFLHVYEDTTY